MGRVGWGGKFAGCPCECREHRSDPLESRDRNEGDFIERLTQHGSAGGQEGARGQVEAKKSEECYDGDEKENGENPVRAGNVVELPAHGG
jgi:hypothetical protein